MKRIGILLAAFLLSSCTAGGVSINEDVGEMSGNFSDDVSSVLFVDPTTVSTQYADFRQKLKTIGRAGGKRQLYEEYVPIIGANGVLGGIEQLWPKCHSEGHDLGKVIFAKVQDVGTSLRVCKDGCYSGCMHGVLMEAFSGARTSADADTEQHVDVEIVKDMMDTICAEKTMVASYSPGDCAHAIGHALMVLTDYDVQKAVSYCDEFSTEHMRYYCATGAYMEYVTENDAKDVKAGRRTLYPCDIGQYPAACARYKMVHVVRRLIKTSKDIPRMTKACQALQDPYRLGCFHGMGNGFMSVLANKQVQLPAVCAGKDDERFVCIEGAMERMAKYHREKAEEVCRQLPEGSDDRKTCDTSVLRGMYDMEKDLTPYIQ